jgi:hypothetical protein
LDGARDCPPEAHRGRAQTFQAERPRGEPRRGQSGLEAGSRRWDARRHEGQGPIQRRGEGFLSLKDPEGTVRHLAHPLAGDPVVGGGCLKGCLPSSVPPQGAGDDFGARPAAPAREQISQLILEGLPETRGNAAPDLPEPFHRARAREVIGAEAKPIGHVPQRLPRNPEDIEEMA